jgi:glycosyltransferase involved in cell wall biosynthesis
MKILMLVPFLPNTQTSGGQTRWYNIIKYLSKSHDITLFSMLKDESEKRFVPELKRYCREVRVFSRPKSPWTLKNVLLAELGPYPLVVIRNLSLTEKEAVKEELKKKKYDLIHAEAFYVMPHIPETKIPIILVEQTIEYMVYKHYVDNEVPFYLKPFYMLDVVKLRYWEKHFWAKARQLVAVSDEDRKIMQDLISGIEVDIIPNGVDTSYYMDKKIERKTPPRILYGVTNFEWLQNQEASELLINNVWPYVKKRMPEAKVWIVGRKIPDWIKNLSAKDESIEITENIPDARDAYRRASVMVAPIKGAGGTRLKILEAMAAGLPVVSTSIGVAGLKITPGVQALISDTYEGLAQEAVRLLKNKDLAERVGQEGQKHVKDHFDWTEVVKLHDPIYKKVLKKS